jgi:hypothetical protein
MGDELLEKFLWFLWLDFVFRTSSVTAPHLQRASGTDLVQAGREIDPGVDKIFALDFGHFL